MILIRKRHEPHSLTEYRSQPNAYFDGYKEKNELRQCLLEEQGYLCAYCMRRIEASSMKIEHFHPGRNERDPESLSYKNMLAVCKGGEGFPHEQQTCDTYKGNQKLEKADPQNPAVISGIYYLSRNGEIHSADAAVERDLNEKLNLNGSETYLPVNRKAALNAFIHQLARERMNGKWGRAQLEDWKAKLMSPEDGKLSPYVGIMIWYLEKKLGTAAKRG